MPSLSEITKSIEARLGELRSEITSLQAARGALHTNGASTRRPTKAVAGTAADHGKRRRPSKPDSTSSASSEPAPASSEPAPASSEPAPASSEPAPASAASSPAPAATSEPSAKPAAMSSKPRARTPTRPAKPSKPAEVLLAGKLEAMLGEAQDGLSVAAIARTANARDAQVRDLLRDLESAGRVRRAGAGRATRWRLITDEERIAERVAELEKLVAAKS